MGEGDAPTTRAFLANKNRVLDLSNALARLRTLRDAGPIREFFERHEAACRQAELTEPMRVERREWQSAWLEVKDLLGSRMPKVVAGSEATEVVVRKLGWLKLKKQLALAWALLRVGAPEVIATQQKNRVRAAYLATGWDEKYAPSPPAPPELDFWSLPVRTSDDDPLAIRIGELDPQTSEQQAWGHAQELIERGVELCVPPLAQPLSLGASIALAADGEPLVDTTTPACAGWVEPNNLPRFVIGESALGLVSSVRGPKDAPPKVLEDARECLAGAARTAASEHLALLWWPLS